MVPHAVVGDGGHGRVAHGGAGRPGCFGFEVGVRGSLEWNGMGKLVRSFVHVDAGHTHRPTPTDQRTYLGATVAYIQ